MRCTLGAQFMRLYFRQPFVKGLVFNHFLGSAGILALASRLHLQGSGPKKTAGGNHMRKFMSLLSQPRVWICTVSC